jgi:hypothetical protein
VSCKQPKSERECWFSCFWSSKGALKCLKLRESRRLLEEHALQVERQHCSLCGSFAWLAKWHKTPKPHKIGGIN